MFQLFARVQAIDNLKSALAVYVRRRGTELVRGHLHHDSMPLDQSDVALGEGHSARHGACMTERSGTPPAAVTLADV
jgi:hypothetical protein